MDVEALELLHQRILYQVLNKGELDLLPELITDKHVVEFRGGPRLRPGGNSRNRRRADVQRPTEHAGPLTHPHQPEGLRTRSLILGDAPPVVVDHQHEVLVLLRHANAGE